LGHARIQAVTAVSSRFSHLYIHTYQPILFTHTMPKAPSKSHRSEVSPSTPYPPSSSTGPPPGIDGATTRLMFKDSAVQTAITAPPPTAISAILNHDTPEPSFRTLPPLPSGPPSHSTDSHLSAHHAESSTVASSSSTAPPPSTDAEATTAGPSTKPKASRPGKPRARNDDLPWLDTSIETLMTRDGKEYIPIYDDCNEVRRKIRLFFSNANTEYKCTQKHFLQVIGNVNSNSYRRFMAAKGEGGGAENGTYTGAYIFFEKKRIYEGKPKLKRRLESEEMYPNGRDLIDSNRPQYVFLTKKV